MEDLGSRAVLEGEHALIWYPAEVNTSIRPGWFYHSEEDDQVKAWRNWSHIYLGFCWWKCNISSEYPADAERAFA